MDRLLANYLPPVLRDVSEIKALLAAEQPEIERLWDTQDGILENQFLVSATEYGIKRWERMLQIYPKDTEGLEVRRARILAILRLKLPYTLRWLRRWLDDLCGKGNYELEIVGYTITLQLNYGAFPEVETLVRDIVTALQAIKPANMLLCISTKAIPMPMSICLAAVLGRGYTVTRLPEIGVDFNAQNTQRITAVAQNIAQTVLPRLKEEDEI